MKNTRLTRLAATGAATALAAAALVGGTGTAANATMTGSATYDCPTGLPLPGLETLQIPVSVTTDSFDGPFLAGDEATGVNDVTAVLDLPQNLVGAAVGMLGITQLGAQLTDFHLWLGEGGQAVEGLSAPLTAIPGPGALPLTATGSLASLVTPNAAGTFPVSLPREFTLVPASAPVDLPVGSMTCTLSEGSDPVIGEVEVRKQSSTIKGRTVETKKGHKAIATVARQHGGDVFGKVVAKLGKKKVGAKAVTRSGKAVFALPKSAHGKTLTLIYKGDSGTEGAKTSVKVK
ncbi:DUF6801 domain-containing protein [Nocardioides ferulae]|uniref:DUF6801 domain-containing protein n=1 Tax=Nocardioides ferulae TaxID=2340821 RepID=UPI000EB1E7E6|nr:DUF6801 domain-containing protein [Nocardioides ferulae]